MPNPVLAFDVPTSEIFRTTGKIIGGNSVKLNFSSSYRHVSEFADLIKGDLLDAVKAVKPFGPTMMDNHTKYLDELMFSVKKNHPDITADLARNKLEAVLDKNKQDLLNDPVFKQASAVSLVRSGDSLLLIQQNELGLPEIICATGSAAASVSTDQKIYAAISPQQQYDNEVLIWTLDFVLELIIGIIGAFGITIKAGADLLSAAKKLLAIPILKTLVAKLVAGVTAAGILTLAKAMYDNGILGEVIKSICKGSLWALGWAILGLAANFIPGYGQIKLLASLGVLAGTLFWKITNFPKKPV